MKKILLFLSSTILAFALQVEINPDKNITVSNFEIDVLKNYLIHKYKFHINEKGARNIIKENRVLANEYLKNHNSLNSYDKAYITIQIEEYLSDKMIKDFQEKNKIDDKIALSYYLSHKEEFKNSDQVDLVLFIFNDPEKAINFYIRVKGKDLKFAKMLSKEYNATVKEVGYKDIDTIKYSTRSFIEDNQRASYFLPPIIINSNSANVLYIKEYKKQNGYKPFEKVKKDIIKILRKKTYIKQRNKLLQEYGVK